MLEFSLFNAVAYLAVCLEFLLVSQFTAAATTQMVSLDTESNYVYRHAGLAGSIRMLSDLQR